jgi:signal transduction histidine kinase/ligand-binding sensor domain-containing protein
MIPDINRITCFFFILLFTQQVGGFAQVKAQSNYLVKNYSSRDMSTGTQNWDFVQNRDGLIYIANRDGILEFDGTEWRRISVTKQTPLRSLAIDENDIVYAGAVGEFGYLEPDSIGKLEFISLSHDIEEIIADVWETHATSHGIYFVTRAVIYRYFNGEISRIKPQNVFQRSFKVGDDVLVFHQGMGLLKFINGELTPLEGAESLSETSINSVLKAPPIFNSNDGMYLVTTARTVYHYGFDTKKTRNVITINNSPVQIPNQLYKAITLKNGDFAFATLSGGLIISDNALQTKHHIDSVKGLQIDMVLSVFEDSDSNIWVGLNNGVSVITEPDYITFWGESTGLVGGVLSLYKHRGHIFVGNSSGLYKSATSSDGLETSFEKMAFENFQIWSMVNHFDQPNNDFLLFGSSLGLFSYYNGTLHRLIEHSTFSISSSVINPYRYYLGFRDGWAIIEFARFNGSELQISNYIEYNNPSFEFRSIEESSDGTLWLGSRFNGIFTVDSSLVWGPIDFWDDNLIRSFNISHGLPNNANNSLLKINNEIAIATENGLYTPVIGVDTLFVSHPLFEDVELSYLSALQPDSSNQYWVIVNNDLGRISQDSAGQLSIEGEFLAPMGEFPLSAIWVENDHIWVGTSEGLMRIIPKYKPVLTNEFTSIIRAVYLSQDSLIFAGPTQINEQLSLKYGRTDITFQYSSPRTIYKNRIRYQTKLEGYDNVWSNWSYDTRRTYTNLSDGAYDFKVRAIDIYGNISKIGSLVFVVESPWFKSMWAYLLYLFLIFMGGFAILKLKDKRFEIRKNKLEEKVAIRTAELQVEKRRLENLNENLKAMDENRDKFLSVVAHDLRNPLMIIRSSSTLIDEEINDEVAVKEFSKYIYDAAIKMQDIIENLLEDRAKKIRLYHDLDEIPIKPIVLKICEENRVWADSKHVEFELDLEENCIIKADSAQIGVIFDNIISNAVKYSPLGGKIFVKLYKSSNQVIFSVRDEGAGMTTNDIKEMGKPFKTLSAKPTAGESSSGMGLYIVKDLLKSHDGILKVSSQGIGKGTTFTVTFKII